MRGLDVHATTSPAILLSLILNLTLSACGPPPVRPTVEPPPVATELAALWVDPIDAPSRDLYYGFGGAELAPEPETTRYDFLARKYDITASSPGYKVRDARGRVWDVKLGPEVRAEVAASRLLWAAGYHQPPTHYVERWELRKDDEEITAQPPARFRPQLEGFVRREDWSWQQNPFVGTVEYRGLVVLMLMLNNWDLTEANNSLFDLSAPLDGASRWYVVWDVGASFSRNRGTWRQGTRGDLEGFSREGFIESASDGHVVFAWTGRHQELIESIKPGDVRWIAEKLKRLRPEQWDDAFRAAGYRPDEARLLKSELGERISAAQRL